MSSPRLTCLFLSAAMASLGLLVGCKESPPSPAPAASSTPAKATAAPALSSVGRRASVAPSASAPAHPEVCEVEFFGQVKLSGADKTTPVVFASYDDCLSPSPRNIGQTSAQADGKFFLEVFVKWGSDLTLCAYQPAAGGKTTKLYGKATGPFHAEAVGEVEFKNVSIEMKPGAARTFPPPIVGGGF